MVNAVSSSRAVSTWLSGSPDGAWSTLKPYAGEHLVAWAVSRRVNTPKNNDADLMVPEQTL